MSFYNIPGDPELFPETVRAATGSAPRNATTNAATASDLADRTAYLYSRTIARQLTLVDNMTALSNVRNGDFVLVKNLGHFYYSSVTRTPVDGFVYPATGKGSGSWIRNDLLPIFGNSDKDQGFAPKIKPSLLPPQLQLTGLLTMANRLTSMVVSSTLITLQESMTTLSGLVAGDQIVGSIGHSCFSTTRHRATLKCSYRRRMTPTGALQRLSQRRRSRFRQQTTFTVNSDR